MAEVSMIRDAVGAIVHPPSRRRKRNTPSLRCVLLDGNEGEKGASCEAWGNGPDEPHGWDLDKRRAAGISGVHGEGWPSGIVPRQPPTMIIPYLLDGLWGIDLGPLA